MPGIFSSRRRASTGQVQRPVPNAPSSAAALAATAAFLKKSPSSSSLSASAAATALRSHTTSPEPIGNLQTKRMVRRASQTSDGGNNNLATLGQRPVVRKTSQGSMTERTFRSPSPGGVSPARPVPAAYDAPPVPAIRPEHNGNKPASRPSSRLSTRSGRVQVQVHQQSGLPSASEQDGDGRNLINFSRPIASPTELSPPVSPTAQQSAGSWFGGPASTSVSPRQSVHDRPRTANEISQSEKSGIEAEIQSTARTSSRSKNRSTSAEQGSKVAAGTMRPAAHGTATRVAETSPSPQPKATRISKSKSASADRPSSDAEASDTDRQPQTASTSGARRPTHTLNKQPSVVMEEPESDQYIKEPQRSSQPNSPAVEQRANQSRHLKPRSREPSLTPSTTSLGSPRVSSRRESLDVPEHSSKSAHFSPNIVDAPSGIRHNPPPRSVSPAKSALKHSPSSSIRTNSPVTHFTPLARPPASDTSDTMSLTSQDGVKAGKKKKKGVRVNFDETAFEHIDEHGKQQPHANGSRTTERPASPGLSEEEFDDETMKPRPALPSFGSVRNGTQRRSQSESPEKAVQSRSSNKSTANGTSNDHAIASILVTAHERQNAGNENDPLPPEVTSVEGSGHFSDSAESSDEEALIKVRVQPATSQQAPVGGSAVRSQDRANLKTQYMEVPDIQVLPATPGLEEGANAMDTESVQTSQEPAMSESRHSRVSVPGSWDDGEDDEDDDVPEQDPAPLTTEAVAALPSALKEVAADDVSDSDDSAAFSDAAEDPSEFEPFGFASMDAIVESPVPLRMRQSEVADSPTISTPLFDSSPDAGTPDTDAKDWGRTSTYWSQQKEQLQRRESDRPSSDEAEATTDATAPRRTVKARAKPVVENATKPAPASQPQAKTAPTQAQHKVQKSTQQTTSTMRELQSRSMEDKPSVFRKTMRGPPPEASRPVHTDRQQGLSAPLQQKTMRGSASEVPRSSQTDRKQQGQASSLQQKTMRPASAGARPIQNDRRQQASMATSSLAQKTMRPASAGGASSNARNVPAATGDSDSESSFRRKPRRGSASDTNKYSMKRSMRSASLDRNSEPRQDASQSVAGAGKWSLRSLSPAPDTPHSQKSNLRTSLRGTSIPEGPTLRGDNSMATRKAPKAPSKFGFSRGAKSPPPAPAPVSSKSQFKSRFADSDSEDEVASVSGPTRAARSGFSSRFADSDDEDDQARHMPADLTPVRGIPRPTNGRNEDSTDLDDSSDDEFSRRRRAKRTNGRATTKPVVPSQADIDKAMAAARQNVAAMTGNQALLQPSTPKGKMQKRILGIPEHSSPLTETVPSSPATNANDHAAAAAPVARRKGLLGSIFGGRRNSSSSVTTVPNPSAANAELSPPNSPRGSQRGKLQRRNTPKLKRSASSQSQMSVMSNGTVGENNGNKAAMPAVREDEEGAADADAWPLEPPRMPAAMTEEVERAASDDGITESERSKMVDARPRLAKRSESVGGLGLGQGPNGASVVSLKTGKKKRFGRLRRAFGLDA